MEARLLDACVVLLGPQVRRAGAALLRQLTVATVRSAFRRVALQTHPDRAKSVHDGSLFVEASRAYEILMDFLLARSPPEQLRRRPPEGSRGAGGGHRGRYQRQEPLHPRQESHREEPPHRSWGARKTRQRYDRDKDIYYRGPLPNRRLRIAEFLYYSGYISWQSLIKALVWQRASRPKFGEIARQLRIVTAGDMARVLQSRESREPTGAAASRLRLITVEDVRRILRIQRARQRPIGRYFVEQEKVSNEELLRLLHELFRHNARCRLWDQKSRSKNHAQTEEATA